MPLRRNRPASRVYVDAELELDPEEEELMEAALGRWIIVGSIRSVGMMRMVSTVNSGSADPVI